MASYKRNKKVKFSRFNDILKNEKILPFDNLKLSNNKVNNDKYVSNKLKFLNKIIPSF